MSEPRKSVQSFNGGVCLELEIRGVMVAFRYCPPGDFLTVDVELEDFFGSEDPSAMTTIKLTRDFWLGETAVTQRLWKAVNDGENPSYFEGLDARPVEQVSWYECDEFIKKLNSLGAAPIGMKFDFPTEAEWEYACRGGARNTCGYNFGYQFNRAKANCGKRKWALMGEVFDLDGYIGETVPVRSYAPNDWGFYEMHGNVGEWCKDWYGPLPQYFDDDPTGPPSGDKRVVRGGSWAQNFSFCRMNSRRECWPEDYFNDIGFRLALRAAD